MRLVSSELPQRPMDLTEWAYNSIKQLILNNTLTADSQIHIDVWRHSSISAAPPSARH